MNECNGSPQTQVCLTSRPLILTTTAFLLCPSPRSLAWWLWAVHSLSLGLSVHIHETRMELGSLKLSYLKFQTWALSSEHIHWAREVQSWLQPSPSLSLRIHQHFASCRPDGMGGPRAPSCSAGCWARQGCLEKRGSSAHIELFLVVSLMLLCYLSLASPQWADFVLEPSSSKMMRPPRPQPFLVLVTRAATHEAIYGEARSPMGQHQDKFCRLAESPLLCFSCGRMCSKSNLMRCRSP